jgi:ectoine hydroxylase-related dioxygenase (phytanoyl-CoA dioxygenase family)
LLRFPDEAASWAPTAHIDQVPPWAPDRRYVAIVGVAISRSWARDGGLLVWRGSHRGDPSEAQPVELNAGDAVIMHPHLSHCSGLNRGGAVRYAAYFRLLTAPQGDPARNGSLPVSG